MILADTAQQGTTLQRIGLGNKEGILKLRKLRKLPQLLELLVEVFAEAVLVILAFFFWLAAFRGPR